MNIVEHPALPRRVASRAGRILLALLAGIAVLAEIPGNPFVRGAVPAAFAEARVPQRLARAETSVPPDVPRAAIRIGARAGDGFSAEEPAAADADGTEPAMDEPTPVPPDETDAVPDAPEPDGVPESAPDPGAEGSAGPANDEAAGAETDPFGFDDPETTAPAVSGDLSEETVEDAFPGETMPPLVEFSAGRLSVRAEGEPLGDVLAELREASGIEIQGLDSRRDEPLYFRVEKAPAERGLKRLMRHLKATNYAFEYSRTRLRRISVFPAGRSEVAARAPVAPAPAEPEGADRERAVRVVNVHEGTQAENLDLRKGDLIVEYDGQAVASAQELVDAVKARSAEQIVQMTVVRDGRSFPLTLNGGLIGVNILTVNVPPGELGR